MKIILWRLGSLEHKIFPTKEAIEKLKNILTRMSPEEVNHIIWDSSLQVEVIDVENVDQYILAYKKDENEISTQFDVCNNDDCACKG